MIDSKNLLDKTTPTFLKTSGVWSSAKELHTPLAPKRLKGDERKLVALRFFLSSLTRQLKSCLRRSSGPMPPREPRSLRQCRPLRLLHRTRPELSAAYLPPFIVFGRQDPSISALRTPEVCQAAEVCGDVYGVKRKGLQAPKCPKNLGLGPEGGLSSSK